MQIPNYVYMDVKYGFLLGNGTENSNTNYMIANYIIFNFLILQKNRSSISHVNVPLLLAILMQIFDKYLVYSKIYFEIVLKF